MSRLRVRAIRVRCATDAGTFGADMRFGDGLTVIDGRNSHGKSVITQGILYVLGMEALLGPRHDVPLTDAMTRRLRARDGGEVAVTESRILLEIEGMQGRLVTLARYAKHPSISLELVSVFDGPVLTASGA